MPGPYDKYTVSAHQHYLNNIIGCSVDYLDVLKDAVKSNPELGNNLLCPDFTLKDYVKQMETIIEGYRDFMEYAKNNCK